MKGLVLNSRNTILLERPLPPPALPVTPNPKSIWGVLSVMYITVETLSPVCFGKVKSEARPDQLIAFARCLREALPIKYRDLPSAEFNQTSTFQLPGSIANAWPLDTQHFGKQALSDKERVAVAAVTHHEQPTR